MFSSKLKSAMPAFSIALAMGFLLAIYGPLELYFTNIEEFPLDFYLLFPPLLLFFVGITLLVLAAFGLCRLIHRGLYHFALGAGCVGYLCTFIQGMYLSGNLPPLDGTGIDWSSYLPQHIISIVLWIIVSGLVLFICKKTPIEKHGAIYTGCACFVSAILLVTLFTVGLTNNGLERREFIVSTKDQEFTLSDSENLIILVVDATDSETFYNMMETTDPELKDILEDFTYYPNTVGAYPYTKLSIPFILTGQWYENQEDFRSFTTSAMDTSPLLTALRAQNYRMGLYEEEVIYDNENVFDFENIKRVHYRLSDPLGLIKEEIKLVWFKYAPFPLKGLVTVHMENFFSLVEPDREAEIYRARNDDFYKDLLSASPETVSENCFRFLHIEGAHVPFRYDRNVNIIDEAQGSYEENIRCSMTIVQEYLQTLKETGVYDNSAILIMADHGYGHNETVPVIGRGNPLLAIKGRNEDHPLQISQAPISYDDLQDAYLKLLDGASGDQVFPYEEGDQRDRRFLLYYYEAEDHMAEYIQTGNASDTASLTPSGREFKWEKPKKEPGKPQKEKDGKQIKENKKDSPSHREASSLSPDAPQPQKPPRSYDKD